jgi:1-acyl-sn-glycerol-3-phosphate acyltransferase
MKRSKKDIQQDVLMFFIKPLARLWMFFDMKKSYSYSENFNRKRKEPYVLLANHTYLFDVVAVPLNLKKQPFIVASHNLFIQKRTKFLLTQIAHAIPKTKSASDIRTARGLIGAVKRGYPVAIFPEGNTTFNGETTLIEPATFKLIKKLNIDVVTCKVQGGYLSKPRWATSKRKNRQAHFHFDVTIPKEKLQELSIDEISTIINDTLYNNDYEYQRQAMIPHPGDALAEGLENIIYICPQCQSIGTIHTHGNTVECTSCNTKGTVNEYGFIEGFTFDNTVEWDHWQRQFDTKLQDATFSSPCRVYDYDDQTFTQVSLGSGTITYKNKQFIIEGEYNHTFDFKDIKNPLVTLRRDFNINVGEKHYLIQIDQYIASFLRVSQQKY